MTICQQTELFKQMETKAFYPHPADIIEQCETHISKVFLAGDVVYKIKKPVNLEFLDFTTLESRQYYCRQELILNRRLTHNVYLDMVAIVYNDGRYSLSKEGLPVEYAVKMRRLKDSCSMTQLLHKKQIHKKEIDALAKKLADFYNSASAAQQISSFGTWETIRINCEENFRQTIRFSQELFDAQLFKIVRSAMISFLHRRKQLFDNRIKSNRIRDCHGDLRTGHIYFTDAGIQIIDCIEFNDRFRYHDVASDLAFLAMDIDYEGHPKIAEDLLAAYARYTGDADIFILINFYKCYRALVRFKVNCIRLQGENLSAEEKNRLRFEIKKYLDLAYNYAICFTRPTLWVVCGMPASGKSTVSEELANAFGINAFNSDVIRKQMFGSIMPFETGIYSKGSTALTYGRLLLLAQEEIEKGKSVILDATFKTAHHRREAIRLAKDMDADILFVQCVAPENLLKKRLLLRENQQLVSDARISIYESFKQQFEPMEELSDAQHMIVYTQKPLEESMQQIFNHNFSRDREIRNCVIHPLKYKNTSSG